MLGSAVESLPSLQFDTVPGLVSEAAEAVTSAVAVSGTPLAPLASLTPMRGAECTHKTASGRRAIISSLDGARKRRDRP